MLAPNLGGLPPATVVTAGFDPLRDEGIAYSERLEADGTPARYDHHPDMIHGFFSMHENPAVAWDRETIKTVEEHLHETVGR